MGSDCACAANSMFRAFEKHKYYIFPRVVGFLVENNSFVYNE